MGTVALALILALAVAGCSAATPIVVPTPDGWTTVTLEPAYLDVKAVRGQDSPLIVADITECQKAPRGSVETGRAAGLIFTGGIAGYRWAQSVDAFTDCIVPRGYEMRPWRMR
jgi:hypothetical protein